MCVWTVFSRLYLETHERGEGACRLCGQQTWGRGAERGERVDSDKSELLLSADRRRFLRTPGGSVHLSPACFPTKHELCSPCGYWACALVLMYWQQDVNFIPTSHDPNMARADFPKHLADHHEHGFDTLALCQARRALKDLVQTGEADKDSEASSLQG